MNPVRRTWGWVRFAILSVLAVELFFFVFPIGERLELATYDQRLRLEHAVRPQPVDPRILLLAIDDESLAAYGRWPWPRRTWAGVVDTLADLGASAVFLDVAFPEAEGSLADQQAGGLTFRELLAGPFSEVASQATTGVATQLAVLRSELLAFAGDPDQRVGVALAEARGRGLVSAGVMTLPNAAPTDRATEQVPRALELHRKLLEAFDRDPRAATFSGPDAELNAYASQHMGEVRIEAYERAMGRLLDALEAAKVDWTRMSVSELLVHPEARAQGLQRFLENARAAAAALDRVAARRLLARRFALPVEHGERLGGLLHADTPTPPVLPILRELDALGADNETKDPDGVLRRMPLILEAGDRVVPSAALALMRALAHDPAPVAVLPERRVRLKVVDRSGTAVERSVAVDAAARCALHWAGPYASSFDALQIGSILLLDALERDREAYVGRVRKSGDFLATARYRELARELALRDDTPVTLAQLSAQVAARWPDGAPDPATWLTDRDGKPVPLSTAQPAAAWARLFREAQEASEAGFFAAIRRDAAKIAAIADPARRAKKEAAYAEPLAALHRFGDELAQLRAKLAERVRGKVCFVGSMASSSTDLAPVPFENLCPKVTAHATLFNTLSTGRFIERPVPSWIVLVAVALLVAFAVTQLTALKGAVFGVAFVIAWSGLTAALFIYAGAWIDVVAPVLATVVTYLTVFTHRSSRTENIRRVFESYVDPRIVAVVAENEALWNELGGVEQNITAFFSDIQGFTSLSELLTAQETSEMLTDYLSPMTATILRHDGTRDKFIGDAIVAFFGAPLPSPEHPLQACLAALEQQRLIVELRARWQAERRGWYLRIREAGYDLVFRIGLNTGQAKVGNFGSRESKSYTMIGDTVNLAARLEGANKEYGTRIMVTQFVRERCADRLVFRELDLLVVKGRSQPVPVYELVCRAGEVPADLAPVLDLHARALALYRARDFTAARAQFEAALKLRPDDGPARLYLDRATDLIAHPPPPDWDGRHVMTHK